MPAKLTIIALVLASFLLGYGVAYWNVSGGQPTTAANPVINDRPAVSANTTNSANSVVRNHPVERADHQFATENFTRHNKTDRDESSADAQSEASFVDTIKSGFYREAVGLIVDLMPQEDLLPLLAGLSGIDEERLAQMEDPHTFGKTLAEVALEECDAPFLGSGTEELLFEKNPHNNTDFTSINSISSPTGARIYAHFSLPTDYAHRDVLVRWCRASPLRNYLFGKYPINVYSDPNYVWFQPDTHESGIYYVHIWSPDETPNLLASGSYEISD